MKTWHRGTLKESLFELPKGTTVVVVQSNLQHAAIDRTFWIVSPSHHKMYHVADTVAGRDCSRLVRVERRVKDEQLCVDLAKKLCKNSQYGPRMSHQITSLLSRSAT
jgi:hypothetical protein